MIATRLSKVPLLYQILYLFGCHIDATRWLMALDSYQWLKANVREKVLFSRTDFLPWEIFLIKKLDFEETKPT
jgi:hypothetical protein